MDATELKAFYDAVQGMGREKLDRVEFEARHANLEARVNRLELELDDRYNTLLKMITDIKDSLAARDKEKLMIIFASVLSFIGGGGLIGLLVAIHVLH